MLSDFFSEEHALNTENDRLISNSLSMLILHSACNNSATFGSSRSKRLGAELAPESHFIQPPKQCKEPSYHMAGWSSDSTVMLPPMGNSLLHKGAHPTLVSKLFLILRRDLPSYTPTHGTGHLPQIHSAWLHPFAHSLPSYTWQWRVCVPLVFLSKEVRPQSLPLFLRYCDFHSITAQSVFTSPPFHSQYVTPK